MFFIEQIIPVNEFPLLIRVLRWQIVSVHHHRASLAQANPDTRDLSGAFLRSPIDKCFDLLLTFESPADSLSLMAQSTTKESRSVTVAMIV